MTRVRYRSDEAAEYRKLYKTRRWTALRDTIIKRDKYTCQNKGCGVFVIKGRKSPRAAVVHHKIPHKGDVRLFYDPTNLECVCKRCHDGDLQSTEARGYSTKMGDDGWPIDARHPGNGVDHVPKPKDRVTVPQFIRPTVPAVLVCGAPGSGKTTHVHEHMTADDVVIDLDDMKEFLGGKRWDTDFKVTASALRLRDASLASLHKRSTGIAWIIISGRTNGERRAWAKALGDARVVVMDTSMAECIRRVRADKDRSHAVKQLIDSIVKWFDVSNSL